MNAASKRRVNGNSGTFHVFPNIPAASKAAAKDLLIGCYMNRKESMPFVPLGKPYHQKYMMPPAAPIELPFSDRT
jgi:hypothetical protein